MIPFLRPLHALALVALLLAPGYLFTQKAKLKKVTVPYKNDSTRVEYEYFVIDEPPYETKQGLYKWYYDDGKLKVKAWYRNGEPDSIYTGYYKSGGVRNEVIYRNGKPNGLSKSFNTNGTLENTGEFVDGMKDGVWKYFDASGTLTRKEVWDRGKRIE